eukprot:CAMPEP_0198297846 /NCGR_PEP_ID=MMETSP1449-20131203/38560_1 /TAXON_ID=420275 /ORGANISM="Attheya septentrionalis, Strain CCMP2084" /LENGTH=43 /DNA_ID= /DNA_START= /DNA_END= /DNA_ORIENTATION=
MRTIIIMIRKWTGRISICTIRRSAAGSGIRGTATTTTTTTGNI